MARVGYIKKFQKKILSGIVLFTDCYKWQNFRLWFLHLVDNCIESIYKTQKSQTKILLCVKVGDFFLDFKSSENVMTPLQFTQFFK